MGAVGGVPRTRFAGSGSTCTGGRKELPGGVAPVVATLGGADCRPWPKAKGDPGGKALFVWALGGGVAPKSVASSKDLKGGGWKVR